MLSKSRITPFDMQWVVENDQFKKVPSVVQKAYVQSSFLNPAKNLGISNDFLAQVHSLDQFITDQVIVLE